MDPLGHQVLDVIEHEGADAGSVVLCHMNHSFGDPYYQIGLAQRGAWLGYDLAGLEYYYPDEGFDDPPDSMVAPAIANLIRAGCGERLLLSSDVFTKLQLTAFGGFGYAHVLENFLPRLEQCGVESEILRDLVTGNPRRLFETAAAARHHI